MLKDSLLSPILVALDSLHEVFGATMTLEDWQSHTRENLRLERPRHAEHGDFSVNLSFLARTARKAPPLIAQQVASALPSDFHVEVVGGFLNLRLSAEQLASALLPSFQAEQVGKNHSLKRERILLEYVSANPTGPLHLGHGRWAALGDSLARILEANGAHVLCEFYVNDFGQQMTNMANSLWFRSLEQLGLGALPEPVEGEKYPYYPGQYVVELAKAFLTEHEDWTRERFAQEGFTRLETDLDLLKTYSRDAMLTLQQQLLQRFGSRFDLWSLESDLHQQNLVEPVLDKLKASGHCEERDGAVWFKSSELGDEKDRVLVKSDGSYTYLTADIAYHGIKLGRSINTSSGEQSVTKLVNIWGADHHGYVARVKASMQALGYNPEALEVVLGQLVTLKINGEKARMGKRSKMLTLEEIVDEVGVDATRFWLLSRSADHTIEFDVDLAASATEENPVFYTQYAHARACSICRMVQSERAEVPLTAEQIKVYQAEASVNGLVQDLFDPLDEAALSKLRELILLLDSFEQKVQDAGRLLAPNVIARYVMDLAAQFHSFYNVCRVVTTTSQTTLGRLMVIEAVRRTLAEGLNLLGVSAPESM